MPKKEKQIIVRFPPSPTGFLHIGGVRTALFNYLFAKKNKGKFILRIEDTDRERYVEGATEQIIKSLIDFGIKPDNLSTNSQLPGEYYQSNRLKKYQAAAEQLISKGNAYECFCSAKRLDELRKQQEQQKLPPKYDRLCHSLALEEVKKRKETGEKFVVRLLIPDGQTEFTDEVFGQIKVKNENLDDQVLLKSDGYPTYHLANVVDDHDMEVSHVIRGEEWVPSTPKHIILYQLLGWGLPAFAHLPLITKPGGKKLSKRDQDAEATKYLEAYEKEAILNYVALLGWNPKTEQEIFSLRELVEKFELKKVNKASAVFDLEKLNWLNHEWVKKIMTEQGIGETTFYQLFTKLVKENFSQAKVNENFLQYVAALILERTKNFFEIQELINTEFSFFFTDKPLNYRGADIIWKDTSPEQTTQILSKLQDLLETLDAEHAHLEETEQRTKDYLTEEGIGLGEALYPLRYALSGLKKSPSPFEIVHAFNLIPGGFEIIKQRIKTALEKLA